MVITLTISILLLPEPYPSRGAAPPPYMPPRASAFPPPPAAWQHHDAADADHRQHNNYPITHPYNLPRPVITRDPSSPQHDLLLPPGTIVTLPDEYGYLNHFAVYYQVYTMPYSQAAAYVNLWSRNLMSPSSQPTTQTVAPWIVTTATAATGPPLLPMTTRTGRGRE